MRLAVGISTLIHGGLLAAGALVLPMGPVKPVDLPQFLPVEFVAIADETNVAPMAQTPVKAPDPEAPPAPTAPPEPVRRTEAAQPAPQRPEPPRPPATPVPAPRAAPEPPVVTPVPEPVEVSEPEAPKPAEPDPEVVPEPEPEPVLEAVDIVEEPEPEVVEAQPDETPAPRPSPPDVRPTTRPAAPSPAPEPDAGAAAKDDDFFSQTAALLDKHPVEEKERTFHTPSESSEVPVSEEERPSVGLETDLTVSEIDAIRAQLKPCWSPPAGAPNAEDLIVVLRVRFNPDGTVNGVPQVLSSLRAQADQYMRAAADRAIRAVLQCQPFQLPAERYRQWRLIELEFDPRFLLGQ